MQNWRNKKRLENRKIGKARSSYVRQFLRATKQKPKRKVYYK